MARRLRQPSCSGSSASPWFAASRPSDQLRFSVWDDGQEKDFKVVDIPLGRSGVVTVRLGFEGRYLTVADGIGITITAGSEAGGERVFDLDPFFPVKN